MPEFHQTYTGRKERKTKIKFTTLKNYNTVYEGGAGRKKFQVGQLNGKIVWTILIYLYNFLEELQEITSNYYQK